jgi:uncharacterized Zn finger protein
MKNFFVLAANHCRLLHAKLWDIETIDEFAFVLDRIYIQTQSFDSPRIAVNFTKGRDREFSIKEEKKKQNKFFFVRSIKFTKKNQ